MHPVKINYEEEKKFSWISLLMYLNIINCDIILSIGFIGPKPAIYLPNFSSFEISKSRMIGYLNFRRMLFDKVLTDR